jgi:hypothetical protein
VARVDEQLKTPDRLHGDDAALLQFRRRFPDRIITARAHPATVVP